ncbi:MAG: aminopeptidase P family N-terminal domain-containing protein [Frankia sp.]|nr:aminopeptidase P family N-terminal domain-containing protein [Frankia sp.]
MPETHERRRAALRAALAELDVEAALVTRLVNVHYLTGFTGSNGAVLVTADAAVLATDGRYLTQSAQQAPDVERIVEGPVVSGLVERAVKAGVRRLGFEEHDVSVELHAQLTTVAAGTTLTTLQHAVEKLRVVKDETEIAALREACAIADRAFAELLPTIRAGRSERAIGIDLDARMRAHGALDPSFETIVAGLAARAVRARCRIAGCGACGAAARRGHRRRGPGGARGHRGRGLRR